jgi:hypothetical protein
MQRILLEPTFFQMPFSTDHGLATVEANAKIDWSIGAARPCVKKNTRLAELANAKWSSDRILAT